MIPKIGDVDKYKSKDKNHLHVSAMVYTDVELM